MVEKINAYLSKLVGPNAVHALDAVVAFELTAAGAALADPSARNYAAAHPILIVVFSVVAPLMTAAASKFRKAATTKPKPVPTPVTPPTPPPAA